jgi:hypothetical protein
MQLKSNMEATHAIGARVQLACMPAATTIMKLMADPKESGTVRLRAAICLLQIANTIDLEDMEARLVELERSMNISHPGFS